MIRATGRVQTVADPGRRAPAASRVLPLPQAATTDEHRTIVARLASARHDIDDGQWKPSISATREAVELLRRMRLAVINTKAQDRTLAEREGAILDRLADFAQALFDFDSAASHPDPHLPDIAWNRENAVLALDAAVSVAQAVFAHP